MRNRVFLGLFVFGVLLVLPLIIVRMKDGAASASETATAVGAFDSRFVGNWELLSYVSYRASGEAVENDYLGRLIYDELGNMSAIGMPRGLPDRARANPDDIPRGGFAYFSDAVVHPEEGTILHHVVGSPTHPLWPGEAQTRFFEFDGELLKLSIRQDDSPEGRVTGTLTWRKMR